MSTLELEHLKHSSASGNSISLAASGSVGIGTTSPDGGLHVKGMSDHGKIIVEHGGTSGSTNHNFISFHNHAGNTVAEIQSEENATNQSALIFKTGGTTTNMTVSHNGHVTMPNQPRFYSKNMNFPYQSGGYGTGGTVDVNVGTCYNSSNGRFTAPVAGTYIFHMMTQYYDGATGSYITCKFYKNDNFQAIEAYHGFGNANHAQACLTQMMTLASGDYINAYTDFGARDIQNFFSGYLIG